jgi:hypothetical protein
MLDIVKVILIIFLKDVIKSQLQKNVIQVRLSNITNRTLITDNTTDPNNPVELSYSFYSTVEEYDDGTSANFLIGTFKLKNINTFNFIN